MALLTPWRLAAWLGANVAAAVIMPLVMFWWITRLVSIGDASLPEGFAPSTLVLAFTFGWLLFLLLLNVSLVLFLWLRGRG
jgi:hypothetical protein